MEDQAKFHVGCDFEDGRLCLRTIAKENMFFFIPSSGKAIQTP